MTSPNAEEAADIPASAFKSGGGFSNALARPSFQDSAVQHYIDNFTGNLSNTAFNRSGRAYPDVSANGYGQDTYYTCSTMTADESLPQTQLRRRRQSDLVQRVRHVRLGANVGCDDRRSERRPDRCGEEDRWVGQPCRASFSPPRSPRCADARLVFTSCTRRRSRVSSTTSPRATTSRAGRKAIWGSSLRRDGIL